MHNINITKNVTLQGNGNPRDIIIDGEKKSTIFLVENQAVHARFNNLTFINGVTSTYGGAISMYSGNVYIDNCHFINNTGSFFLVPLGNEKLCRTTFATV